MQGKDIITNKGNTYHVESFYKNNDVIGGGRSYSLTLRKVPSNDLNNENTTLNDDGSLNVHVNLRFNFLYNTVQDLDFVQIWGKGEQGLKGRMEFEITNYIDEWAVTSRGDNVNVIVKNI